MRCSCDADHGGPVAGAGAVAAGAGAESSGANGANWAAQQRGPSSHQSRLPHRPQTAGLGDHWESAGNRGCSTRNGTRREKCPTGRIFFGRANPAMHMHATLHLAHPIVDSHHGTPNHWMAVPGLDAPRHDILTPFSLPPVRRTNNIPAPSPTMPV